MEQAITTDLLNKQMKQKADKEKIAEKVIRNPESIKDIVKGLKTDTSHFKFGYEKILRIISEKKPELIYPYFDDYAKLLDSDNTIIKWGAIFTIANLAEVDSEKKFEKIFKKYYAPVTGPVMITAGNIIGISWKIAFAKPHLSKKIVNEILKIQNGNYYIDGKISQECKNICCGHAIKSFSQFYDKLEYKKPVIEFVKEQLSNKRPAVKKKAEKFLKKLDCKND
ncbi:MAG: hypothetical protein EHM58_08790 [Ignavibacteriae bacterium]|nr:MAG: hypothetical protein EHM58_08790 [Ignavibacteriota bacterium]